MQTLVKEDEITKYLNNGKSFIDDLEITSVLAKAQNPSKQYIQDIIKKSLSIETLLPEETAALLNVTDEDLWQEIFAVAQNIKTKVYDNRVVTFAPLYCSNHCINNCMYCGFRRENDTIVRRKLSQDEIKKEVEILAGKIGHKRLIVVFGEHPSSDIDYMTESMKTIYSTKTPVRNRIGEIRRVNVNCAPLSIEDLIKLREAGIGTYQVFQETYHLPTYQKVHPSNTVKGNYLWRLYAHHRAMEAEVDDIALGVLFGLYDYKFEVMGLLYHARDLEKQFGVGPHTVSFPRLEAAANTPFIDETQHKVSDDNFKKLIAVIRLSMPYTGMIITARENPEIIKDVIPMCTQRDASTRIGIGSYADHYQDQEADRQQFILGDTRSLDEIIRELAAMGYITSFCTSAYRCGRTGANIMELLKSGKEGSFCKLNAILTFREWLEDFGTEETQRIGKAIIEKEIAEVKKKVPHVYSEKMFTSFMDYYNKIVQGERDLCF